MGSRGSKKKRVETNNEQVTNTLSVFSTSQIIDTMNYMINELGSRGVQVKDFDNKYKTVKMIKIIGGKPYFLSE
ncbi:hypothetical protein [Anaerosporobacter faecicola]|uniref:hypothetical protein n=1 Tax=Anaerosporobacter faecicola TaxID=2718714 RepID=UPI0014399816|nr:hypothetical protein [Anaerosporobacter faecicola]